MPRWGISRSPDCSGFSLENDLGGEIGAPGSLLGSNAGTEVSTYPAHRCEYPGRSHQSYSSYHEKLGNRLLAEGDTLGAAEHYRLAQGLFSARQRRLKDQRCNALFRSGEFQTCVDELAPDFEDGVRLFRHGYRALWRSYTELGLYAEAREVAEVAMGKYTQLETECTGVFSPVETERACN